MTGATNRTTWLRLVDALDALLREDSCGGTIPPAVSATTRRHARALLAALRADLEREYPTQAERAAAWGVGVATARRHGL